MANVPDDSKSYFAQENLPEPLPPEINIVPSPTGSQVEDGSLRSPNFRTKYSGWSLASDGTAEFQNLRVGNENDFILWDGDSLTGSGDLTTKITRQTYSPFTGTTSPVPAMLTANNLLVSGDANNTDHDDFLGFVNIDVTPTLLFPDYLSGTAVNIPTGDTTFSLTAGEGADRYIVMTLWHFNTLPTLPTSITWNGYTVTKLDEITDADGNKTSMWTAPIGTSGSDQTADVTMTGGSTVGNNVRYASVMVYAYVSQTDPYGDVETDAAASGTTSLTSTILFHEQGYGLHVCGMYGNNHTNTTSGTTERVNSGDDIRGVEILGYSQQEFTMSNATGRLGIASISLNSSKSPVDVPLIVAGQIGGFTGLTIGSSYYLSNTRGEISSTPGATSVRVGRATSTTELLIIQP